MDTSMETHGNCCIGNSWKPMDTNAMGFHGFPHLMETHGNLWTSLWIPMAIVASETRGNPWTPNTWVSMGFHILWKPMETSASETHGNPYLMETYGNLRTAIETAGNIWNPYIHMETYGNQWKPVVSYLDIYGNTW